MTEEKFLQDTAARTHTHARMPHAHTRARARTHTHTHTHTHTQNFKQYHNPDHNTSLLRGYCATELNQTNPYT
jgi:hypothetical protein